MHKFDDPTVHSQIQLFFDLMEVLYTNDSPENTLIDTKIKQLLYANKTSVTSFFETVIDQPAFQTSDHSRLRENLIDWYTTHKTLIDRTRGSNDVFGLTSEALNELLLSFGFPYPTKIISTKNKALFLLDLVNLYNKKGSPEVLVKALEFFDLTQVTLSEWWIRKDPSSGLFIARSQPIIPRINQQLIGYEELTYDGFIRNDPHWQLSETELATAYSNNEITLPSITPHFSIDCAVSLNGLYRVLIIITKKMQEAYDYWVETGELNKDIVHDHYGINISFLELCLAVHYVFNGQDASRGQYFKQWQGRIDTDWDGVDEYDYEQIVNEYDDLHIRPKSKIEQQTNYKKYQSRFTANKDNFFVKTSDKITLKATLNPDGVTYTESYDDSEYFLGIISPELKGYIDLDIESSSVDYVLENLLILLDGYVSETMGVGTFSIAYFISGSSMYKRLKPIIEFFKPYRTRIREFLTSFLINDPLADSQLEKDYLFTSVQQQFIESSGPYGFDNFLYKDYLFVSIYQNLEDMLTDRLDANLNDGSFYNIIHQDSSSLNIKDNFSMGTYLNIHESSGPYGLDNFMCDDDCHIMFNCNINDHITDNLDSNLTDNTLYAINQNLSSNNLKYSDDVYFYTYLDMHESNSEYGLDNFLCDDNISITNNQIFKDNGTYNRIVEIDNILSGSKSLLIGEPINVFFDKEMDDSNYTICAAINNTIDPNPSNFNGVVTNKTKFGFTYITNDLIDTNNYKIDWLISREYKFSNSIQLKNGVGEIKIIFNKSKIDTNYSISVSMINTRDPHPSIYPTIISNKTVDGFTLKLSGITDTVNYSVDWIVMDQIYNTGSIQIPNQTNVIYIEFPFPKQSELYTINTTIVNMLDNVPSIFSSMVISQSINGFTILLSDSTDSENYMIDWTYSKFIAEKFEYYSNEPCKDIFNIGTEIKLEDKFINNNVLNTRDSFSIEIIDL